MIARGLERVRLFFDPLARSVKKVPGLELIQRVKEVDGCTYVIKKEGGSIHGVDEGFVVGGDLYGTTQRIEDSSGKPGSGICGPVTGG